MAQYRSIPEIGDRVLAKWPHNGIWYIGKVVGITEIEYFIVNFDDGDVETLPLSMVRVLGEAPDESD
jgi:hypothetical protein